MGRGTHRGFITHEELNKSLGKRNLSDENLSQAFIHILNENISLVEKKSDFKVLRKKEKSSKDEGKSIEKSDDPIRMYLREMGGVELLSREGEIAIAKRIEAGKDVMLIALSQSPITAQQFFEWDEKLQKDEILVREIIDIDTNYMEDESTGPSAKQKNNGEIDKDETSSEDGDDDFNPTLAAMESEIKPKVLSSLLNAQSIEPDIFVQSTVNRASKILSQDLTKEQKIEKLKMVAEETVDIKGIGFYTLGGARKNLSDSDKEKYTKLFKNYFLKSFSSRLAEYTNPEIDVIGKKVLNENYTIVNSVLKGTNERPEIKIDWRIYTESSENPMIRDLIIEGLSLARTQKEEFSSILSSNNGDINSLFKTLENFSKN